MRVVVCGSKNWSDRDAIRRELRTLRPGSVVIHGGCPGADQIGAALAGELGLQVEGFGTDPHPEIGDGARNQLILDESSPDAVWCFHADLGHSDGSRDMVRRAQHRGVPVRVIWG